MLAAVIAVGGLLHKGYRHIAGRAVESLVLRGFFKEGIRPVHLVVQGAGQGDDRSRVQFDAVGLFGQQALGLLIQPFLQHFVVFIGTHAAFKGGCRVLIGQRPHGLHVVAVKIIAKPDGIRDQAGPLFLIVICGL